MKGHEDEMKNELLKYPKVEQEKINQFWTVYAQIPSKLRNLALDGLLHYSCFPQLSYLSNMLDSLTKVDFLEMLPNEVSFKILNYLDATALCRSSQTSKKWKELCDNDVIWKRMFQQHVDKVCTKCGWGLPSMISSVKRKESVHAQQPFKKQKTSTSSCITFQPLDSLPLEQETPKPILSRPWKSIYAERCVVAKNWKKSRFSSKNLIGHTDAVMEMYFDEARSLLISASMDGTLRAWNTDSGLCVGILKGHTAGVRSVQFDDSKIVSCSIDKTIRIWSRKTFECVRVIEGHSAGLVSIHFIDKMLASGCVDGLIRVWNLEAGCSFSLRGHRNWANKIHILPGKKQLLSCSDDNTMVLWDIASQKAIRTFSGHTGPVQTLALMRPYHNQAGEHINRVVTGSLDHTIKIWDYNTGELIRTLFGHTDGIWCVGVDGIRIVSGSHDGTVKLWDIETGKCIYTIESHSGCVYSLWLADTKLISADSNGIITVRDFLSKTE